MDEQRDQVLVEDDDEAQQQPGATRPDRSAGRRSCGRSASRSRPRHAAASSNSSGRSFMATTIGVSISGNVPTAIASDESPASTRSWYVNVYVSSSASPMTAPGTYSGQLQDARTMIRSPRERVADERVGRRQADRAGRCSRVEAGDLEAPERGCPRSRRARTGSSRGRRVPPWPGERVERAAPRNGRTNRTRQNQM